MGVVCDRRDCARFLAKCPRSDVVPVGRLPGHNCSSIEDDL